MKCKFFLAAVAVVLLSALVLAQSTQSGSDTPPQPPSGHPLRVRVSSEVAQGLLIKKVTPQYPEDALQNRIQGVVVVSAVIGKDGEIREVALVSGHPMLAPAALKAVKKWKYRPYLLNGQPMEVETLVVVNFSLTRF
jgi:protein TonB